MAQKSYFMQDITINNVLGNIPSSINYVRIPIEPLCEDVHWPYLVSDFTIPLECVDIIKDWYKIIGFTVTDEAYNCLKIAWNGFLIDNEFVSDIWLVPKGKKIALC